MKLESNEKLKLEPLEINLNTKLSFGNEMRIQPKVENKIKIEN